MDPFNFLLLNVLIEIFKLSWKTILIILVGIRYEPQGIITTPDYIIAYACLECGFFSKEGSGSKFFPINLKKIH